MDGSESLSSVLGWVSIACWVVVYSPQIYENYELKSGEGLSVSFVLIWLIGDICSLVGAVLAGLLPTIVILSAYYTSCDLILLFQIYYYRWTNPLLATLPFLEGHSYPNEEQTPLLPSLRETTSPWRYMKYLCALLFVFATGVIAWAIDAHVHKNYPRPQPEEVMEWRSQLLGWISAIMFLSARVPQILKNMKTRCEGLSPALFLFSISGNVTYFLSILAASTKWKHLSANASWIAGSTLTVFLDVLVLIQFFYYQGMDLRPPTSSIIES